jgi:NADPH:quinone reductase-like Zn-dependent oxidoreductase
MQPEPAWRQRGTGTIAAMITFAQRIHSFGSIDVMTYEEVPMPRPGPGEVLVRIEAAGVGPWDALIRTGASGMDQPLPLTLGSDISGVVVKTGKNVVSIAEGDAIFGVTNAHFTGGYAGYAAVEAHRIARRPRVIDAIEGAALPVITVTAWKMLHQHGEVRRGQRVLVHGAAGNVGACVVEMARAAGAYVIALGRRDDEDFLYHLGADEVGDYDAVPFERALDPVDIVIDTVGGDVQSRSFDALKPGGVLISIVAPPDQKVAADHHVRAVYFIVDVTAADMEKIAELLTTGEIVPRIGIPLSEARRAHQLLAERPAGLRGKIVLDAGDLTASVSPPLRDGEESVSSDQSGSAREFNRRCY